MPLHAGLHHHGKDESRPGYTLEEAAILARSHMPSQRVIALRLLADVARKLKAAHYPPPLTGAVPSPLRKLCAAGKLRWPCETRLSHDGAGVQGVLGRAFFEIRLPLLLRTALDDNNVTVVACAVDGLHALLVNPEEEQLCETLWTTLRGTEAFPLLPDSSLKYAHAYTQNVAVAVAVGSPPPTVQWGEKS